MATNASVIADLTTSRGQPREFRESPNFLQKVLAVNEKVKALSAEDVKEACRQFMSHNCS